ncbi:ABC transporter ATP-binding protein [bacterium CG17_big_fil_post_rev_8_21_14_2_50_64_8]|nr:MAG: ABC transporter ATP-binding protein [bacterium CG17_big_fil_post_rev_8_21_14_2_50_64_8]PJA73177.1 MAG: ABC transporter ATP-binding protein [bacterium CG_4_9_14_3_um_filter_65_15]
MPGRLSDLIALLQVQGTGLVLNIRCNNLSKNFRRTEVLKGADLVLDPGDRIALVGSNGAGKTTLIRCLLGEYTHGGQVLVDGIDPRADRTGALGRIGFVPQLPPPLKLTVGRLLGFTAEVCGSDIGRMADISGRLGLDIDTVRRRPFAKLSGGEKQKLMIGIALGRETELLIMDEPAANLDPTARHVFFGLLAELKGGHSMIISSHRLDEVAPLVNRVVEMDRGRIVLDDHVDDRIDLAAVLRCTVAISRPTQAFAEAIGAWGFRNDAGECRWQGMIAGPDRLRFLGMLSRYAALVENLEMTEGSEPDAPAKTP